MSWYKRASINYSTWLAEQVQKITNNYTIDMPHWFNNEQGQLNLENWVKETRPDLSQFSLRAAWDTAEYDAAARKNTPTNNSHDPKEIHRNMNRFFADTQNTNPEGKDFAVDTRTKDHAIPSKAKKAINNAIHDLGNYHIEIPLQEIFDICKRNGVVVLQEDGTQWSGFLMGRAECGSEKARNQRANLVLAVRTEDGTYFPTQNALSINWCTMQSGKYEVVAYVS